MTRTARLKWTLRRKWRRFTELLHTYWWDLTFFGKSGGKLEEMHTFEPIVEPVLAVPPGVKSRPIPSPAEYVGSPRHRELNS